jgi:hypothetical protein
MRIMQFMTSLTLHYTVRPELINVPAILAFGLDSTPGISNEIVTYGITHLTHLMHMFQPHLLGLSRPFSDVAPTSDMAWGRTNHAWRAFLFDEAAARQRELGLWKEEERLLLKCESIYSQAQDSRGRVVPLCNLSNLYARSNKRREAEERLDEAVAIHHQLKVDEGEGVDLYILGDTYMHKELTTSVNKVTRVSDGLKKGNELEQLQLLLETGKVEVDSRDLAYAARKRDVKLFKLLMDTQRIDDFDARDKSGCTPLDYAMQVGNPEMVKLLLETGKVASSQAPSLYRAKNHISPGPLAHSKPYFPMASNHHDSSEPVLSIDCRFLGDVASVFMSARDTRPTPRSSRSFEVCLEWIYKLDEWLCQVPCLNSENSSNPHLQRIKKNLLRILIDEEAEELTVPRKEPSCNIRLL